MTRRERLENKLERRREWAAKANARSEAAFTRSHDLLDPIPFGQPNVNGRLTGVLNRGRAAMDKSCEESRKAEYHESKAAGLERQLKTTIFSDDPDAIEALQKKIAKLEELQNTMKGVNKICRKKGLTDEEKKAKIKAEFDLNVTELGDGFPPYALQNNNAEIRRAKQRIEEIKRRQERQAAAEEAENGVIITGADYISVTFAEKPEWEILRALKSAGFYWRRGSWHGRRADLPESVQALTA